MTDLTVRIARWPAGGVFGPAPASTLHFCRRVARCRYSQATLAKGTGALRWQRPVYVDHLPPCNNACPAGLNIQEWLALAQAGSYEDAWRQYMQDNPLPALWP